MLMMRKRLWCGLFDGLRISGVTSWSCVMSDRLWNELLRLICCSSLSRKKESVKVKMLHLGYSNMFWNLLYSSLVIRSHRIWTLLSHESHRSASWFLATGLSHMT
jgi:hypothetical protein